MRWRRALCAMAIVLPLAGAMAADAPRPEPAAFAQRCSELAARLPSEFADAKSSFSAASATAPAHCTINAALEKRTGADGRPYAIAFELRVPSAWNGRVLFQGGGGLNGILFPATGRWPGLGATAPTALQRGFAVVSTDSGHVGGSSAFAADQLATVNYAYAAIGKVAIAAKDVTARLTGRRPDRTYYAGCSNGGREAMLAAQRFPEEFDGVIAQNPAFNVTEASLLANYSSQIYIGMSKPDAKSRLTQADLKLVGEKVVEQCDALDGQRDRMIFAQAQCRFDPAVLACRRGQNSGCLDKAKVDAIGRAFRGPVDGAGVPLFAPWSYDSGVGDPMWLSWQTGPLEKDGTLGTRQNPLVADATSGLFLYPPLDPAALATLDPVQARRDMAQTSAMINATSTRMSTFAARGGKMLLLTGWSDPIFSPHDLIRWYEKLDADEARVGRAGATAFARLFLVPGLQHCRGGEALDDIDMLTALTDWVEKGTAPERLIAKGEAFPGQTRPLCAYPAYARYVGRGDPADQASYVCSAEGARPLRSPTAE